MTSAGRVLVTDSGTGLGRSSLAAVRAAHAAGWTVHVGTWGSASLAARSRWCHRIETLPAPGEPSFADAVEAVCRRDGIEAVLPASDAAVLALRGDATHLVDKRSLYERARSFGLPTPDTASYDDVDALEAAVRAGDVELPLVVKPVVSTSPARRVDTVADLHALVETTPAGVPVLAQHVVDGPLTSVGLVVSGGEALGAVEQVARRTWPREAGTSCFATTVAVDEARVAQVVALAAPYEGILQVQFIGGKLIDANPRVFGSLPLAVASGVNLVALELDRLAGRVPRSTRRGKPGVAYRWVEGDLRHLVSGVRSRDLSLSGAARALIPRMGTAHSVESMSDPIPTFARLAFALSRRA